MIGRTNTGGGGAALNFKIVGNPQPANPKENTIWIDTDKKIPGYVFSPEEPVISDLSKHASGKVITLNDSGEAHLSGLTIYGRTVQNGTPTPEAPVELESVGGDGSVKVTVTDENILALPYSAGNSFDSNGIYYEAQPDGSVICNGTTTAESLYAVKYNMQLSAGTYWLGGYPEEMGGQIYLRNQAKDFIVRARASGTTFTLETDDVVTIWIDIFTNVTVKNIVVYPVLCKKSQSVTVTTENGLCSIPVSEGGNYTDADGQQWVRDEIDFANGKRIQRVGVHVCTGEDSEYWGCDNIPNISPKFYRGWEAPYEKSVGSKAVSSHMGIDIPSGNRLIYMKPNFAAGTTVAEWKAWLKTQYSSGNPVVIHYVLETPIYHNLSAEELLQYSTLNTKHPITTIYNDSDAEMDVVYGQPSDGTVWIRTGLSSDVAFNALKKNDLQVYPLATKQYIGSAWVDKDAKTYQNGQWVEWIQQPYLYDSGNEFTSITGGWEAVNKVSSSSNTGTITKNADSIYIKNVANGSTGMVTVNQIDLTNFTTIHCICTCPNVISMSVNKSFPNTSEMADTTLTNVTNQEMTLDVSYVTGAVRIGIFDNNAAGAYVYKVWLT